MTTQELIAEALELPVQERASLAQALWESLTKQQSTADEHILGTAIRRGQELDSGAVKGRSREDAMRAAREALR